MRGYVRLVGLRIRRGIPRSGDRSGGGIFGALHPLSEGKRAAEALHRAYHSEYDVDTRIARIFNTYGSGADPMDQRVVMKMIVAALQNRDIPVNGSGEQLRTFCWVEDIVEGLVRLMEAPPSAGAVRTVNLGSNHEISIRALAEKIVSLTGSRSRIVHTGGTSGRRKAEDTRHLGRTQGAGLDAPHAAGRRGCAARSAMQKRSWRTSLRRGHMGGDELKREDRMTATDFDKIIWRDALTFVDFSQHGAGRAR